MRPRRTHAAAVLLSMLAVGGAAPPAVAGGKVTLTTSLQPLDIPVPAQDQIEPYTGFNQGWWDEAGHDWEGYDNTNYATGWSDESGELRSFFTFHLGGVRRPVTSATLRLQRGCASSPDRTETVRFWDVSTPAADLNRGSAPVELTRQDLASGVQYGRATIPTTAKGTQATVTVKLNRNAVRALNRAIKATKGGDGYFSIGAAVATLDRTSGVDETVFGCTGSVPASLVLTTR